MSSKESKKLIRVLLADDHSLFRSGMRALLSKIRGVKVVAEASDGYEALKQVESRRPHIAFLDITMKGMNGLEALRRMTKKAPWVKAIVLSMHADKEYVAESLRSGAVGYVVKDATIGELRAAIRFVVCGKKYVSRGVDKNGLEEILSQAGNTGGKGAKIKTTVDRLTPRQREVLQLIGEGLSTKQIAEKLGISFKTADTHRTQLMTRLGIHDVAGLVRYAIRKGVVTPES